MDNAPIHRSAGQSVLFKTILNLAGISLIFLPTYSPELNPCELCFGKLKRFIRENRDHGLTIAQELTLSIPEITQHMMRNFYHKCIEKVIEE